MYEHVHINLNKSNDIFSKILVVENIVDTNQESEKIELSINKKNSHQKLTHGKKDEAIINEMVNSNEKKKDYNDVSCVHSFLNDNFDNHSNLYYDDNVVDDHMSYDELLDAFKELFIGLKKCI